MPLFPVKTPDEIVFGAFFLLAGVFFYRIFEFEYNVILKHSPKVSIAAGVCFLVYGSLKIYKKKEK